MAKQTKRFQYQQRDPSVIKTRSNQRGGDFDSMWKEGIKIYKPREGKNTIRIVPPTWKNPEHHGYDIHVNYGIGVDEQAYLSLSAMKNEPDPLAEGRKRAEKEGNKALADSLRPSRRVAFYLIDRMAEEEGVQCWPAPWTVDKSFCGIAMDIESGAVTMVDDPYEGYDIIFFKEGTGMTTKYPAEKMRIARHPSSLSDDEGLMNQWLDYAQGHPIPDMLNFYDYDHIAGVFEGHVVKDSEDEGSKSKQPRTQRPVRVQAADDDNEEVDSKTGEITPRKNGKSSNQSPNEDVNEEAEAKMSVSSIRERLAGRRPRPSVSDED